MGYLKAGSLPSLYAGLGLGGTLGLLGYGELSEFKKTGATTRKWSLLSLVITGGMTAMMGAKCKNKDGSGFITVPAVFATSSLLVAAFCAYRVVKPVKPKTK